MTLKEAEAKREELVKEIQQIQVQLGDRDRQVKGERLDSVAYWKWRRGAKHALTAKLEELREANAVIKRQHPQQRSVAAGAKMIWAATYAIALRDECVAHREEYTQVAHACDQADKAIDALARYEKAADRTSPGYESACMMLGVDPKLV